MKYRDILIIISLVVIGTVISVFLNNDKPTAALTAFSLFLAALSTVISVKNSEENGKQTERALELTEKTAKENREKTDQSLKLAEMTLKKAETEQQIRDIENRLEKFYMPAQNAIILADGFIKNPHDSSKWIEIKKHKRGYEHLGMNAFERANIYTVEELKKIEQYRFLAKEDTCKSFVKYVYEEENEENYLELSRLINRDIENYQGRLNDLRNN